MAGGASSQVNEDDESEINVLAYDGSHRQYSAEKYGRARNSYQCDLENGACIPQFDTQVQQDPCFGRLLNCTMHKFNIELELLQEFPQAEGLIAF